MAEDWFRMHAEIADKPIVGRAMEHLDVTLHQAVGLMAMFWGKASRYAKNGNLSTISDIQLEKWARWEELKGKKKRGQFAKFIREYHADADGRVNEWDEYNGALDARREREASPDGKTTYVFYFVDGERVRIGWGGNPWARLNELRETHPQIRLAAIEKGPRRLEQERHVQFTSNRLERDWFKLDERLKHHIQAVATPATNGATP